MKHVLVLIGAGASADCDSDAATCNEAFRPPLTAELFNIKDRTAFGPALNAFEGAIALAPDLAEQGRKGAFSLEHALRRLAEHDDPRIRRHFYDIPRYLSALFRKISEDFTHTPGAYVRLAQRLLADHPHRAMFVSLNYDNLLEQALHAFDPTFVFQRIDDYCDNLRQALVVKPHGSIHWSVDLIEQAGTETIWFPDKPWRIKIRPSEVFHGSSFKTFPVISAPMASKGASDLVCPDAHLDALKKHCADTYKALFIGTSCLDDDILKILATQMPHINLLHVVILGGKKEKDEIEQRVRKYLNPPGTRNLEVFDIGFRDYLNSDSFEMFCQVEAVIS